MPKVWNRRGWYPGDAVYIGRPSRWGNPIRLESGRSREQILYGYTLWLLTQPGLVQAIRAQLQGQHLVCWCAPRSCHGDVMLAVANSRLWGVVKHDVEKFIPRFRREALQCGWLPSACVTSSGALNRSDERLKHGR